MLLLCSAASATAELRVHDVLNIDQIATPINDNGEPIAIELRLSAMGQDILLQLQPSRLNRVAKLNGMQDVTLPYLYEGIVAGDVNSWARISIENGQPSGHLFHYGKLLQLENRHHLRGLISETESDSTLVLIEPASSDSVSSMLRNFALSVDKEAFAPAYKLSDDPSFSARKNVTNTITNRNTLGKTVTRAMRVGIVVDSLFNEVHQNRGLARALSIMNSVDAIYQSQLGIAIIVEGIRVYDNPATDPMRDNIGNVATILSNFKPIRQADARLPADLTLVHLFTGHRDPERVIGLGWISTACRLDGFDLSMSTPFPFDTLLAAHEIAHNLGALHDDNAQCLAETNEQSNTLMWPALSGSSTAQFSQCSTRDMQASLNASCNLDNIDVGVRVRTFPSSEFLRRSVIIDVANKDLLQRSTEVVSRTKFPTGTLIEGVSAGCSINASTVNCNHGTLQAQTIHSISMTVTLQERTRENVQAEIELLNDIDLSANDNRAVVQLLTFDESTGEALAAASEPFADNAVVVFQQDDTVGGTGSASATSIASLLLLISRAWCSMRRRRLNCN